MLLNSYLKFAHAKAIHSIDYNSCDIMAISILLCGVRQLLSILVPKFRNKLHDYWSNKIRDLRIVIQSSWLLVLWSVDEHFLIPYVCWMCWARKVIWDLSKIIDVWSWLSCFKYWSYQLIFNSVYFQNLANNSEI